MDETQKSFLPSIYAGEHKRSHKDCGLTPNKQRTDPNSVYDKRWISSIKSAPKIKPAPVVGGYWHYTRRRYY